ncbi:hypothetical protein N7493_001889 [Penicillium malachiteum]|uniref:SAGA-like transcriptional regulatory complex subunit Spt3 n=1 Tax=Penicillium malachiteum TaxID=1324776 RepID=A0AAD6HUZ9_9EURO|nr:hypothetical protein N7493_001889 [Penicillium malachiteum]
MSARRFQPAAEEAMKLPDQKVSHLKSIEAGSNLRMSPLFVESDREGIRSDLRRLPRALARLAHKKGYGPDARPVPATAHCKDSQLDVLRDSQSTSSTRTWIPTLKYQQSQQEAYLLSSTRTRLPSPECHPRQVSDNVPNHLPPHSRLVLLFLIPTIIPLAPGTSPRALKPTLAMVESSDGEGSDDANPGNNEPDSNGPSTNGSSSPDDLEHSGDDGPIAGAMDPFANNPGTLDYLKDLAGETEEDMEDVEDPFKTEKDLKVSIINMIRQMMFVSGETAEPSIDTTTLIEDITRQQVLEILTRSTQLATRRGSRSISTDDLIFLIRHDKAKVSRLRTFLSWKDVRKNVKDSDDKGGADAADFAGADDAAGMGAGPQDVANKPKNKRAKVGLAWDVHSFFSVQIPERDDEEDEEEEEQNYATLQRLAAADERTKNMTREEYVFWSECRQASFTYRKSKRFREWAGFGIVTESKPNDDIVDILGFLTFEIVQTLTEEALKVKEREDHEKNRGGADTTGETAKKRKRETGLFDPPEEGRTPIEPRHIREAYRKLQATPQQAVAMLLHNGRVPARNTLRLI